MLKRRKLLYPCGLISLAILPLFCLNLLLFTQSKPEFALEVIYWNPKDSLQIPSPLKFTHPWFSKIDLNGNSGDAIKLELTHVAIQELVNRPDTTQGIEISFSNSVKYSSLVKLYNYCLMENVRAYCHLDDKFYIFNFKPREAPGVQIHCGTTLYNNRSLQNNNANNLLFFNLAQIKSYWPIFSVFGMLVLVETRNCIKHLQHALQLLN